MRFAPAMNVLALGRMKAQSLGVAVSGIEFALFGVAVLNGLVWVSAVEHLRLIMGTSMGCMHAFVWGETDSTFASALMSIDAYTGKPPIILNLREEAAAPLTDVARQFALMIGKIEERARRGEFLSLEQQRNARHQQEISGHCAKAARARSRRPR